MEPPELNTAEAPGVDGVSEIPEDLRRVVLVMTVKAICKG